MPHVQVCFMLDVLDVLDPLNWLAVLDCDGCARFAGFVKSAGSMRYVESVVGVPNMLRVPQVAGDRFLEPPVILVNLVGQRSWEISSRPAWLGPIWLGLAWFGIAKPGLACSEPAWLDLAWRGLSWLGWRRMAWLRSACSSLALFGPD